MYTYTHPLRVAHKRSTVMSSVPARSNLSPGARALLARIEANLPTAAAGGFGRGRLIFALDATASRQPTWDSAVRIQSEMFEATAGLGGLSLQLVYFRGLTECKASKWLTSTADLHR